MFKTTMTTSQSDSEPEIEIDPPDYPVVVTVALRKGGSSKTTTARYLAEYFARFKGKKVLSLDLDSQCNLSSLLMRMERDGKVIRPPVHEELSKMNNGAPTRPSVVDLYQHCTFASFDVEYPRPVPNWEIIPGDSRGLYALERQSRPDVRERIVELLRENVAAYMTDYDLVVIDTGPTLNDCMLSALRAATHLLCPFQPHPQAMNGIEEMVGLIRADNEYRLRGIRPLKLLGFLPTQVRPVSVNTGILNSLRGSPQFKDLILPFEIPYRAIFQELDAAHPVPASIFDANRREHDLVKTIMVQLGEHLDSILFPPPPAPSRIQRGRH